MFGTFRLNNVEVAIMPNMQGEALLGMNVLKRFHIQGDRMNDAVVDA